MRYALRAVLFLVTLPVAALGFLWHCAHSAFLVGDDIALRSISWVLKDKP